MTIISVEHEDGSLEDLRFKDDEDAQRFLRILDDRWWCRSHDVSYAERDKSKAAPILYQEMFAER